MIPNTPYVFKHGIIIIIVAYLGLLLRKIFRPDKLENLKNKHVIITGGSSGIGKSIAILAAKKGAIVTIIARNVERLECAAQEIRLKSNLEKARVNILSLDCSDQQQVEKELLALDDELPITALINCAGMAICGRFEELSNENIKKLVDINLYGTIFPTKTLLPRMKKRRSGIIVLTASQAALVGLYGYSAYSATKFAVRGLAEALHMELRAFNISVTLALPPDTNTAGFEEENRSKPLETQLITETRSGLYEPDTVAKKILFDALNHQFFSFIGIDSYLLSTLCVGMSPHSNWLEVIGQTLILGPIRFIAVFYLKSFHRIISRCLDERENPIAGDMY